MKNCPIAVTSVLGIILSGCIPTLHPVYTDGDLVFEELLMGVWQPVDEVSSWEFAHGSEKTYQFVFTDKNGEASEFEAHLVRFNGLTYLDLRPTGKGIAGNDFYKAYFFPLHTFLRVDELGANVLKLSSVDGNWLKKRLLDNPQILDHEQINNGILVTASPKELQGFLKTHNDTPNAFSRPFTLHRR